MDGLGIAISVATFIAGSLLTIVIFVIPLVGRIARVETILANLVVQINKMETTRMPCVDHVNLLSAVAVHEEKLKTLQRAST